MSMVIAVLAIILSWHYVTAYRTVPRYYCDEPATLDITHPYLPLVGDFVFTDSLEVYIGGWIERGALQVEGDVIGGVHAFSAGQRPAMISHARLGEWYDEGFRLTFEPTQDASCLVRVVYRFRGIY